MTAPVPEEAEKLVADLISYVVLDATSYGGTQYAGKRKTAGIALLAYIAGLENRATLLRAQAEGAGSLLRDVQQDCIRLRAELATERAERFLALSELEQARKDAERYRWLRHGDNDELVIRKSCYVNDGTDERGLDWLPRNKELDSAIDAALTGTQEKQA